MSSTGHLALIPSSSTRYSGGVEDRSQSSHCPLLVMVVGMAISSRAQDRLPPIPADRLTDAQKKAIAEFKAARGVDISGPFVPLLRSPEVMNRARAMGDYLRFKRRCRRASASSSSFSPPAAGRSRTNGMRTSHSH